MLLVFFISVHDHRTWTSVYLSRTKNQDKRSGVLIADWCRWVERPHRTNVHAMPRFDVGEMFGDQAVDGIDSRAVQQRRT